MKRVLSLLLSLLLLLGCAPARQVARAYIRADKGTWSTHGQTAFGDMVLSYPDPDAVMATLDEALACVGTDGDARELVSVYETQLTAYNELVSATSLAYIRYCQDVTDGQRAAEYGRLNGALYSLQHRLAKLEKALMDRWGYHRERGTAYADSLDKLSRQDADRQRGRRALPPIRAAGGGIPAGIPGPHLDHGGAHAGREHGAAGIFRGAGAVSDR